MLKITNLTLWAILIVIVDKGDQMPIKMDVTLKKHVLVLIAFLSSKDNYFLSFFRMKVYNSNGTKVCFTYK